MTLMFCNAVAPQVLWFKKARELDRGPLRRLADRQRRDVARALHHRRHEPPPRLPPLLVGDVPRDEVGQS